MKLSISKEIFQKFPDLKIGVVVAKNINNKGFVDLDTPELTAFNDPRIRLWNQAYRSFGTDPAKHKPSIANLIDLARRGLPNINKLVNIYNYVSLKHTIPAGGSDLDKISDNIFLRVAKSKQPFTPLHSKNIEYTKVGEIIYSDKDKIITRRWNCKESDFAKFTENTKNAILEFEALQLTNEKELVSALKDAVLLIKDHCGGNVNYFILDKNNPTLDVKSEKISSKYIEYLEEKKPVKIHTKKFSKLDQSAIDEIHKVTHLPKLDIANLLEVPPDPNFGDLSFPCFTLAKEFSKSPVEVAKFLREKIISPKGFQKIEHLGPYLNFFYDGYTLSKQVLKDALKKDFGYKNNTKTIVIEFPSPNTNKPLHLGHIRNMSLGKSIFKTFEALGWKAKEVNLNNDRGVHICKSMLAYQRWGKNKLPNKKSDHFVGDFYIKYAQEAKKNPNLEKDIQDMLKKWEEGDKEVRAVWKKMNKWAFDGFNQTYKRFGINPDKNYYESKMYDKGKDIILEGLKKGLFYKDVSGAVMFDLSKKGLGQKVMLRSNGTAVYITQDIYLAKLKYEDYKFDKSVYIIGNEQDYHTSVLFEALNALGFKWAKGCYHLSYGMVYLPDGRMKSREGNVVDADNLMDQMSDLALKEVKKRNPKLSVIKQKQIAEKIGLASIKYFILKFSAKKDITFNPKQTISFEGDTGPYLQYSLVRANKILQKSKQKVSAEIDFELLKSNEEQGLIKHISNFPKVIELAAENYSPHFIANYAYELSQKFSTFYAKHRVIGVSKPEEKARLLLVKVFYETLKKSLNLLGIEEVDVM
jgi:arginyl-tRNA synthetase